MSEESGPMVNIIRHSDLMACPKHSLMARHYREDGSCRCDEREAATQAVADLQKRLHAAQDWKAST